nr:uncharacterized protein LOC109189836 [Ipomoea batatas]
MAGFNFDWRGLLGWWIEVYSHCMCLLLGGGWRFGSSDFFVLHPQSVDHVHVSGRVVDPPAGVLSEDVQDQQFVTPVEVVPRDHCSPICGAPLKAVRPVHPIVDSIRSVGIGSTALSTSPTLIGDAHFAQWVLQSGSDNFGWIACCEDLLSLVPGMEVTIAVINVWTCILNHRERTKPPTASARVLASPLTTDNLGLDFAIGPYKQWSLVNLVRTVLMRA